MKKRFLVGIFVSIFFVWLILQKVNLRETLQIISSANITYLLLILLLYIPMLTIRGLRWKIILNASDKISTITFIQGICVSQMTNNLIPLRAGDFAQAYFLGTKANLNIARVFSSVILERIADFIILSTITILGSSFALFPAIIRKERIVLLFFIVVSVVFITFKSEEKLKNLIERILPAGKPKEKILKIFENFYTGLHSIKDTKQIIQITSYSILLWFLSSLGTYLCLNAVSINIGILPAVVVFAVTSLNFALPASPANLGTYEFFAITAVSIFGVDKNSALSFALLSHLISWLPITLLGLGILSNSGITFKTISRKFKTNNVV
ncbi:MAG: lysylphosphatidylglycerol synthase transmembrane domain-containing protein [Elusimicrobiota bacterium]|nr:lysylphosphatidylglycerol synthase transmembrane domain-containing protein [Elusimicrobiota bacterium]